MIQKERLKELIKRGAAIYVRNIDNIAGSIDFCEYEGRILKNCFQFRVKIKPDLSNYYGCESNWSDDILLENLFETKEDAEFACKYKNISRIDYLHLPLYEDFIKKYQTLGENLIEDEKCVMFTSAAETYSLYATDNEVWVGKDNSGERVFNDKLTKENYEKACEICRKLFLGE